MGPARHCLCPVFPLHLLVRQLPFLAGQQDTLVDMPVHSLALPQGDHVCFDWESGRLPPVLAQAGAAQVNHDYEAAPIGKEEKHCPLEMGKGMTLCVGAVASPQLNRMVRPPLACRRHLPTAWTSLYTTLLSNRGAIP